MGKLFAAVLLVTLLISTQYSVICESHNHHHQHHHKEEKNIKLSTPEECDRPCKDGQKPLYCYWSFTAEHYTTLTAACNNNQTLHQCVIADGFERGIMTVNRQIPGSFMKVCKGDKVIVDFHNKADGTGLTIHWHGIFQEGSQYYDGVPMVTQCPVHGGNVFRYQFCANNSGSHMFHSHDVTYMSDGLYGALIVRDAPSDDPHYGEYDYDEHVIVVSDWFHTLSLDRYPGHYHNHTGQAAENFLINGLGKWRNPNAPNSPTGQYSSFTVQKGKRYRFRVLNLCSTVCLSQLSIMGHRLKLIAQDGEPIVPVMVDKITSSTGERVDFILHADQDVKSYWIMVRGLGECEETKIYQLATLHYAGTQEVASPEPTYDTIPRNGLNYNPDLTPGCRKNPPEDICIDQIQNAHKPPPEIMKTNPDVRLMIHVGFFFYDNLVAFGGKSYPPYIVAPTADTIISVLGNVTLMNPPSPPLTQKLSRELLVQECPAHCDRVHVYNLKRDAVVELVLRDDIYFPGLSHPFHLHGHSFYVFDTQSGNNRPDTDKEINDAISSHTRKLKKGEYKRPCQKDTVIVPTGGHVILRFIANNPGWWLFHCHFTWHTASGMGLIFHVGSDYDLPPIPKNFPKCGNFIPPVEPCEY